MNKFKEYIDNSKQTPFSFAKKSFISFSTIKKLYNGGNVRIDIAKRVVRAAKKDLTLGDLGYGL